MLNPGPTPITRSSIFLPASAVALAAGCHSSSAALLVSGLAAFGALLAVFRTRGLRGAAAGALLMACVLLGSAARHYTEPPIARPHSSWQLLTVISPPKPSSKGYTFIGRTPTGTGPMRSTDSLQSGRIHLASLDWRPFKAAAHPWSFNEKKVYRPKGYAGRCKVRSAYPLGDPPKPISNAAAWNAFAVRHIRDVLASSGGTLASRGLVLGLLTGDKRDLPPATRGDFSDIGLSHLLAVSGFHVGLFGGIVLWLAARLLPVRHRKTTAWLLAAIACWAYIMACGAPNSAVRAGLMGSLAGAGVALGRVPVGMALLGAGGWVLLLLNPTAVHDLGTQCSFIATAAILLLVERSPSAPLAKSGLYRLRRMVAIPVVAQWATAPIILPVFYTLPLAFLPANLLAAPWVMLTVLGTLASLALGAVWPKAGELLLTGVLHWADWGLAAAKWTAWSAPPLHMPPPSATSMALLWASVALLLYVLRTKHARITCLAAGLAWGISTDRDRSKARAFVRIEHDIRRPVWSESAAGVMHWWSTDSASIKWAMRSYENRSADWEKNVRIANDPLHIGRSTIWARDANDNWAVIEADPP